MTPAELLAAVRGTGADLFLSAAGTPKVRRAELLAPELRELARRHRDELAAVLQDEAAALRLELAGWLERWENGCRWFAADPGRAADDQRFELLASVASGWCDTLEALEALAPADPALEEARLRFAAAESEVSAERRAG
jgi:hypothetical protein